MTVNPLKKILVGLDIQPSDEHLIAQAVLYAKAFKSEIWLIHVTARSGDDLMKDASPTPVSQLDEEEMTEAQKAMKTHCSQIKDLNISVDGQLLTGSTTDMLLSEIDQVGAELLIIGEKKHGLVYKALIGGSTSSKILKAVGIPVLIVPIPEG